MPEEAKIIDLLNAAEENTKFFHVDDIATEINSPTGKGKKQKPGWIKLALPLDIQPPGQSCHTFQQNYMAFLVCVPREEIKKFFDELNKKEGEVAPEEIQPKLFTEEEIESCNQLVK